MKRFLLLALTAGLFSPIAAQAFWFGLSEQEQSICRQRAAKEQNEFSAKQTYDYCNQTIKNELKTRKKALTILKAKREKWNQCKEPFETKIDRKYEKRELELPTNDQSHRYLMATTLFTEKYLEMNELRAEIENTCGKEP